MSNDVDLSRRVALVTGAGRGLGWGIAVALARAGAKVCATDVDERDLGRVAGDIEGEGGTVCACRLDASDREAFRATVQEVLRRWGRVDALVHAAIYMPLIRFEEMDDPTWDRQLDVGLGGLYAGIRAVWDTMVRQGGGHVVGIASGSSVRGYPQEVAYCTLKHAQEGLVKALSMEARDVGIALNTVGPGAPIKTTRITWEELERLPREQKAAWTDPRELGRAFAWLVAQPPARLSGYRLDAAPIVASLDAEGPDFELEARKITDHPEDHRARAVWYGAQSGAS